MEAAISKTSIKGKRQKYQKVSSELKSKIAKYEVENGVKAAGVKFKPQVPDAPKNWRNTGRDWKVSYLRELGRKRKAGEERDILCLPVKKRGRPLMIGDILNRQVQQYISELRKAHATVNTAIVFFYWNRHSTRS